MWMHNDVKCVACLIIKNGPNARRVWCCVYSFIATWGDSVHVAGHGSCRSVCSVCRSEWGCFVKLFECCHVAFGVLLQCDTREGGMLRQEDMRWWYNNLPLAVLPTDPASLIFHHLSLQLTHPPPSRVPSPLQLPHGLHKVS